MTAPLLRQALTAAAAAFSTDSAFSWYAKPNTSPARSTPVWAEKPAVNIDRFAARASPAAATALPAAYIASGSTDKGATREILVETARRSYSPNDGFGQVSGRHQLPQLIHQQPGRPA
ncbi:hypothetical protein A5692_03315 [Mycobacterium sp. E342]|nr:hypothetical protein A5692_03315 [Mycobacterium sp. E342]